MAKIYLLPRDPTLSTPKDCQVKKSPGICTPSVAPSPLHDATLVPALFSRFENSDQEDSYSAMAMWQLALFKQCVCKCVQEHGCWKVCKLYKNCFQYLEFSLLK